MLCLTVFRNFAQIFEHLTLKEKFIYIMSTEGPTAQITAKFIADNLP